MVGDLHENLGGTLAEGEGHGCSVVIIIVAKQGPPFAVRDLCLRPDQKAPHLDDAVGRLLPIFERKSRP